MKVLVVGGAGYIGAAVTDMLLDSEHQLRVYDALIYEESYRKPVPFFIGDIRQHDQLAPHLLWADIVIWLAAFVGDGACELDRELATQVNEIEVGWLAENFDGRIIFMSTCSVYGACDGVLDESSPTNPLSTYARTKLAAERFLTERNAITFRLGTLFGVSDLFARIRLDLVVNMLTVRAAREGRLTVFGGDQFRPLLHVKDAALAAVQAVDHEHTGIFALHRQNVRILDLAYQIRNHFPDAKLAITEMPFQDTRNYRINSDRARQILGWTPQQTIDDGIEEVKELVSSRRLKDVANPRYTNASYLAQFTSLDESLFGGLPT